MLADQIFLKNAEDSRISIKLFFNKNWEAGKKMFRLSINWKQFSGQPFNDFKKKCDKWSNSFLLLSFKNLIYFMVCKTAINLKRAKNGESSIETLTETSER